MTSAEVIALSGCSRPEDGRACKICLDAAQRHVRAVEEAGMVVVSAEDLWETLKEADKAYALTYRSNSATEARLDRLRAALAGRTLDG